MFRGPLEELRALAEGYRATLPLVDLIYYDAVLMVRLHFALTGAMACPIGRECGCAVWPWRYW